MNLTRHDPHRPPRIFFSAGEPSGDLHAANLMRAIRVRRPDIEFVGYGGPQMAAAGCTLHEDLTVLAVMWFLRVVMNIHRFLELVSRADRYFRHERPDAVVLIDYPGFNWWIARRAKAHGIPVYYYCPPQVWAWAGWRVKKMRRYVDHVLCTLPFEEAWLRERGVQATFVGHPFFDEVRRQPLDDAFLARMKRPEAPLVTLLPGSRTQEVNHNLRWLLAAAAEIRRQVPQTRFAIAAFKPLHAKMCQQQAQEAGLPVDVFVRKTPELMHLAQCCLAVSGSVSLELLYHAKPTAVLYWISPAAYFVQGFFRRVKYITLVNLLAARELFPAQVVPYDPQGPDADEALFPEYLTCEDKSAQLAQHAVEWLTDEARRTKLVQRLESLRDVVGHGGASARAAEFLLAELAQRPAGVPRPHFLPGMKVESSGPVAAGWHGAEPFRGRVRN